MFSKVLVANRGEIAVRIIRACKEMGIPTVAVYSQADENAIHARLADESYCIGSALPRDSYLNQNAIITAALVSGSQAIHPGYGFLSENASFATLCAENNITFIGPPADVISKMGDKDVARKTMQAANVPVVPGCPLVESLADAVDGAKKIGFPLLIKARSGGGGRGIKLVESMDTLESSYMLATSEAQSAFSDGAVYLERYLSDVKHIEMQILCDKHGGVVCLGERDCSMQRKNQKLIEESPAPLLPDDVRCRIIEASTNVARAVGYVGAGTIEYLYESSGDFYFMEMNTRLQVEHPVTEMVTGIDLVQWQIRIAAGLPLSFTQDEVVLSGHAIECRINSESPYDGFRPSCGNISMLHVPGGPWVRFDTAIYQGYDVPPFYDSMIGKLIVHAKTRDGAVRKMKAALCELIIDGIDYNADFQLELLSKEQFENGSYNTSFLSKWGEAK